jgi:hypothetical protein
MRFISERFLLCDFAILSRNENVVKQHGFVRRKIPRSARMTLGDLSSRTVRIL